MNEQRKQAICEIVRQSVADIDEAWEAVGAVRGLWGAEFDEILDDASREIVNNSGRLAARLVVLRLAALPVEPAE